MLATYRPILALLASTAFLLAASGLHGLVLPLRGQAEGFATSSLGLLGSAWAAGFVAGCFFTPRLVRRVGHIRAFAFFAATAAIIALLTGLWINEYAWIGLRALTGFAMSGSFMVIESWLNERSTNANRGAVFGLYMMVTYAAITGGQLIVMTGDVITPSLFMLAGIFFCAALIPTAVTTARRPRPLRQVKLDLKGLYANSPAAVSACLLVGIANGAWGTLGPVYGARAGIATSEIALMMSMVVLAGAFAQLPVGRISDRADRRLVLAGCAMGAVVFALVLFAFAPRAPGLILALTAGYGALAYTLYSVAVAHANDHAAPQDFIKIAGGLLLVYGFGTMFGPLLGAFLMERMRPESLFLATALPHALLAAAALFRVRQRPPVPSEEREAFTTLPAERAATPQAVLLDPRLDEAQVEAAQPPAEEAPPVPNGEAPEQAGPAEAELAEAAPVTAQAEGTGTVEAEQPGPVAGTETEPAARAPEPAEAGSSDEAGPPQDARA